MSDRQIYTMLDAVLNRSVEGLRVCEDILRFVYHHPEYPVRLKTMRHDLVSAAGVFDLNKLVLARGVSQDRQKFVDLASETRRAGVTELITANLHRSMEGLRTIEESSKSLQLDSAPFQKIRFAIYEFENEILSFIKRENILTRFRNSLYAIIDTGFVKQENIIPAARELIDGGASIIQLRAKNVSGSDFYKMAAELQALLEHAGVPLVINDRADIALAVGAAGLHIGQDDMPVSAARKILSADMIIGLSTHSQDDFNRGLESAADYLALGPVYSTASKNGSEIPGLSADMVHEIITSSKKSLVLIGGLTPENIAGLAEFGSFSAAMISYLYQGDSILRQARSVCSSFPKV